MCKHFAVLCLLVSGRIQEKEYGKETNETYAVGFVQTESI